MTRSIAAVLLGRHTTAAILIGTLAALGASHVAMAKPNICQGPGNDSDCFGKIPGDFVGAEECIFSAGQCVRGLDLACRVRCVFRSVSFDMVVSQAAGTCLPKAAGHVTIERAGDNQRMEVKVEGLPPNTGFTFFVLQTPTNPPGFSMAWYQGDIETDKHGRGSKQFLGIFSSETHIFAVTSQPAPQTDIFDAPTNPATLPVHMYHLGIWFSDPADATAAGCPGNTTPFDGDHVAGIQVLNTSNFGTAAEDGPLGQFKP